MKRTVAPTPHLPRAGLVVAIASLAVIGSATLLPEAGAAVGSHLCLVCGSVGGVSAILNILLFVPLGTGLALLGIRGKCAIIAMFALSVLIETAQLVVIPGRYSTVGDVLTNSLGGALGFAIGRYAFALLAPSPRVAMALTMGWSVVWLAIQTISAFGFSPSIPRSQYYGQLAPRLGDFELFRGRVLRASIADVVVADAQFKDSPRVQELLLSGATVTTTIVPPRSARAVAPIVRVADASEREIMLLAQNGVDLVFGVRTGAGVLRLRPPIFALPDVFSSVTESGGGMMTDTLILSARYSAHAVWMSAQTSASYSHRIPITQAFGWTMLMPFQWYIEGTRIERIASKIWVAALLLPIGYWGLVVVRFPRVHSGRKIRVVTMSSAFLLLYTGLVVVPETFWVAPSPPSDWLAAVTGIVAGLVIALRQFVHETNPACQLGA